MSANVETMMYVREKPWHGLGTMVPEAPTSADALRFAGLDWTVRQEPVYNARGGVIPGYKSNVRDTDGSVLGAPLHSDSIFPCLLIRRLSSCSRVCFWGCFQFLSTSGFKNFLVYT